MTDPDTGAFIWYELMTPDPDAAKIFYDAVIGWDIAARDASQGEMDYRMIRRSDGGMAGGVLALSQDMLDGGARPAWYGYVHVADVDAAKQAFEAAGGTVHFDQTMEGVGRMALVTDGQGAPLYVMTPTPPEGDPDARSDVFDYEKAQHVRWNELSTTDQDGAIAFYTDLFGWRQEGAMPIPGMSDYKFLHRGEGMIGAVMEKPPAMPQSNWVYSIGVDAIDRAVAAVKDGGGTLLEGPHHIPGGEFSAVCTDPHGVAFGLVGPRVEN
ncbi:VOC family protein [Sphingomicrobium sp. XHP0239]|uniref:VOC family protein n=1 Tax=Sphingomicrobium maritimum TaxID=3133972 RepID=UPI0031CC7F49